MVKIKSILWFLLIAILWLPMIQAIVKYVESAPLKGAFTNHPKPIFSDSLWFDGEFQKNYELYINDSIGFHNEFIKFRNQVDYSLFNKCHAIDIEIGKEGYLVATTHIDAALGKIHTEESSIDSNMFMLSRINDTLNRLNKTLVVLLAPNKGHFLKEMSPAWYNLKYARESDYQKYTRKLKTTSISFIDCNDWFTKVKPTSTYPLFTKTGIHWSSYGAFLAGDSMIRLIEKKRNIDMPDILITNVVLSDSARAPDADLNDALNLIWQVKSDKIAYPTISFITKNKTKPSALFIGDSFFFNISNQRISVEAFGESSFWYYNNTIFSFGPNNGKNTSEIDVYKEIDKHDVIVLVASDINLPNLGWGFIKTAYDHFYNKSNLDFYKQKIRSDSTWYSSVVQKAKAKNISIEEQLIGDAAYAMSIDKK